MRVRDLKCCVIAVAKETWLTRQCGFSTRLSSSFEQAVSWCPTTMLSHCAA